MSLGDDVKKFANKTEERIDALCHRIVGSVYREVIVHSPIGKPELWKNPNAAPPGYVGGRFAGNWQVGVDAVPSGVRDTIAASKESAIKEGAGQIPTKAAGHVYWIVNNLPYARSLEYGYPLPNGGLNKPHSKQAPHGMVGITVAKWKPILSKALAEVKR